MGSFFVSAYNLEKNKFKKKGKYREYKKTKIRKEGATTEAQKNKNQKEGIREVILRRSRNRYAVTTECRRHEHTRRV